MTNGHKKRQRSASAVRLSSSGAAVDLDISDGTLAEVSQKLHRTSSCSTFKTAPPPISLPPPIVGGFNDQSTADVILRLFVETSPFDTASAPVAEVDSDSDSGVNKKFDLQLYVHSSVLRRAKYFDALLSERWMGDVLNGSSSSKLCRLNLGVAKGTGSIHVVVIRLLYCNDLSTAIYSVPTALNVLPIALKLLFEDCVKECVRLLESVPWSEEEERQIVEIIPLLSEEESKELLARVSPQNSNASEDMLHNLVNSALHNHSNVAAVKAFVANLLRDFPSKVSARRVLESVFSRSLKAAKDSLEDYSSPDLRGNHGETEAIQRLNLHTATMNCKHLLWLVERMTEMRVADFAVAEWSEQSSFAADLQRAFREDACRNIVPGLPNLILKCTSKLVGSVASGTVLAPRQVRQKLVENWLPVLVVCKDNASPVNHKPTPYSHRSLHPELEEAFLRIISTLPMAEAQLRLQQCLSFSTRDPEGCAHLVKAFNTWFRRAATHPPLTPDSS